MTKDDAQAYTEFHLRFWAASDGSRWHHVLARDLLAEKAARAQAAADADTRASALALAHAQIVTLEAHAQHIRRQLSEAGCPPMLDLAAGVQWLLAAHEARRET